MANREMFQRILKQIELNPKSFRMAEWEDRFEENDSSWVSVYFPEDGRSWTTSAGECGTTRCVAGWAVFFDAMDKGVNVDKRPLWQISKDANGNNPDVDYMDYQGLGADILGIGYEEADDLFHTNNENAYNTVKEYAEGKRG